MSTPRICVVSASAGRPADIAEQVKRALAQLTPAERMVVVIDGGEQPTLPADDRLTVAMLATSVGVNHAYRIANGFVPPGSVVVKVDDHDWLEDGALARIREAFTDTSVQFAYGDFVQVDPRRTVRNDEAGHKPNYIPGSFRLRCAARGLAAYRIWLYQAAGGWPDGNGCYPAGDMILWMRMEEVLRRGGMLDSGGIVRIPHVLNEVVASVMSITGQMGQAQSENATRAALDIVSHDWQPAMEVAHTTLKTAAKRPPTAGTPLTTKRTANASPSAEIGLISGGASPFRQRPLCYIVHSMWGSAKGGGGGEKSSAHWQPALEAAGFDVRVRVTDGIGDDVKGDVRLANGIEIAAELRAELPDLVVMRDGMQGAKSLTGIEPLVPLCRELGIPAIVRMQFWRGLFDFRDDRTW
ncbi:MAG: hypothetical protein KKD44_26300, partial [Proteobacteria bacterium]|nr:hypothetical protein [Pseudomonadota bacterium]